MGDTSGLEAELLQLMALLDDPAEAHLGSDVHVRGSRTLVLEPSRPIASGHVSAAPGEAWSGARGSAKWRLSPSARSLTRLTDGTDLVELIGPAPAQVLVSSFLGIRPSGGRVFVDENGDAVTPVEGRLVYLGRLATEVSESPAVTGGLKGAIVEALRRAPGSTAREIAYELGRHGRATGKSEINSLIYRDKATFVSDGASVPRWRIASTVSGGEVEVVDDSVRQIVAQPRAARLSAGADVYRDLVAVAEPVTPRLTHVRASSGARPLPALVLDLMTWQREAVTAWYANGCHGIIEAVTGTGKTHLGLEAVALAARDGERSTVLVPSVDLQDQWAARFETFLPDLRVARLGGRKTGDPRTADVTIAVVNSALLHDLSDLSGDSLLVADEVHRYGAEQFQYALKANYKRRLGLTATLERSGDDAVEEVLSPYFGGSIMTVTFDRAIREGVVAPFRLVLAPVNLADEEQVEYDGLSRQISNGMKLLRSRGALGGGSNISMQLGRLRGAGGEIGKAARMAETAMRKRRQFLASVSGKLDAIEELSEMIGSSQGTVIFTQSKGVAESAALVLREWGVPASALHSDMNDKERRESLDDLSRGALQALAAPKLLDEGIDVPTVDLGVVMTASRSRRQMVQRLGRVIRRKDDGRSVDFVILFAHETVEDPSSGVHEGFFDLVGEVATRTITLEPGWTANDLAS